MSNNRTWSRGNYNGSDRSNNSNWSNNRNNGNSNGNALRRRPIYTEEELERGTALKAEREQAQEQKKAECAQFASQWPEIRVDFEPALYLETYKKMHSETLAQSISKLQQLEELSAEEAERKVFDILVKTTFIELNLVKNGGQKVETLFENLELATGLTETMPFSSPADLEVFLKSMAPVFRQDIRNKRWSNTGVQTRRFCQWLMERLQLGDVIEQDNVDETLAEFKTTIKAANENAQKFAEKEAFLDISSYPHLARAVPSFSYDKATGRLSMNKDVFLIALHLPILADTLHSSNPKKLDSSRVVTTCVSQYGWIHPNRGMAYSVNPELEGIEASIFRNKFCDKKTHHKQLISVSGLIAPSSKYEPIEVMEAEPIRLDFSNNFVVKKEHMVMDFEGKKNPVTFDDIKFKLEKSKQLVIRRTE